MTFITYAQNFEDVMLWRALKNVQNGFYVDIGANDPTDLSVTRAFYDAGWNGINIEPVYSHFERLQTERPRDINFNIAAGNQDGETIFYEIPASALSTTDSDVAQKYQDSGMPVKKMLVPVQTLNRILAETAEGKVIHFMNIDVEGGEANVLHGLDLSKWRPWIILIESTIPTTTIPNFQEWESILISNGYEFVYFDALNRFYVAKEHANLKKHFELPPNLFDEITLASQVEDQYKMHLINTELSNVRLQGDTIAKNLDSAYKTNQKILLEMFESNANLKQAQLQLAELKEYASRELATKEQGLVAKEQVIQNFRQSLYYSLIHGPVRFIPVLAKTYKGWERLKGIRRHYFMSKLGVLSQYPPKPFDIPASYFHVEKVIQPAPTISIVTPTYNYAHFLERTLKSVIYQGYPELEYIIQDGGSTDDTVEIVEKFKHHLKHFESCKDDGQAQAINLGFQHATGQIMAYLNSDDVLLPGTLDYVANYFSTHPAVDVVYGHRLIIDENDMVIGDWIMPAHDNKALRWADYIPQETLFWRRRIWERTGGQIDESFHFAMDWDLLLRFQDAGAVFERLPRFLAAFRVHIRQKTSAQITDLGEKEARQLRLRNFGREVNYREINRNLRKFRQRSIWHYWKHKLEIKQQKASAKRRNDNEPVLWYQPESIYFYSLHKAGTSLFTHVLRQADELTHVDYATMLFDNELPKEISYQKRGKLYGVFRILKAEKEESYIKLIKDISQPEFVKEKTIVFLVRDPRDILISLYYSMGFTHISSANQHIAEKLQDIRNKIQAQDLDDFVIDQAPNILERFEILYKLSEVCKHRAILKYENLVDHFDDFMREFSKYISIPEERKQELFQASRPRVAEDPTAHKRSGKIGQYHEKLKPDTVRKINQILRPALEKFGYDID